MNRALSVVVVLGSAALAPGQTAPLRFDTVRIDLDSGVLQAPSRGTDLVFSETVETPGSDWIRLWFGQTVIPDGAELIVTSARTGEAQFLSARTLEEWSNSSAYFTGDTVYVDLYVPAGSGESRVVVSSAHAGLPPIGPRSICGSTDDRVISNDPRASRLAPQGCTAWLFNNRPNSAITAAHCGAASGDTLWFNVPLRTSSGGVVAPHPRDQYPVDGLSVQAVGSWSIGNDWAVFGVFNNSNTGLSPVDAQKASYVLATSAPAADGRPITITGYGSTSWPVPPSWYAIQKTHTGTYFSMFGSTIRYRTDTTGGNSGSAVFDEQEQRAIGVHTNGGCSTSGSSSNSGTSVNNGGWRNALLTPRGIAAGPIPAVIRPLAEAPGRVGPDGSTAIGVEVVADFITADPLPEATLHSNDGSGWVATEMTPGAADQWHANFPPTECGSTVRYYFSARGSDGSPVNFPPSAPTVAFETISTDAWDVIASHDFETDAGWTVENTDVNSGAWERGVPSAADRRGGPNSDADGSGSCWTTGLGLNVDLSGGPTRLVSPEYDLSGATDPYLDVSLWLNDDGSSENMVVEFSDNGGLVWTVVEILGSTPGWRDTTYRIADKVALTGSFRVRFSTADLLFADVIEAGVDAVVIRDISCPDVGCGIADLADPVGVLDLADIQGFIVAFLAEDPAADLADPFGVLDLADLSVFVEAFLQGCP